KAFLTLYDYLSASPFESSEQVIAVALGICGFFSPPHAERYSNDRTYRHFSEIWTKNSHAHPLQLDINAHQCRPFNHPIRRLVALALLVCDRTPYFSSLDSLLAAAVDDRMNDSKLKRALLAHTPQYTHPYWEQHYTFGNRSKENLHGLIGDRLKQLISINTLFPLHFHLHRSEFSDSDLNKWLSFYEAYNSVDSGKSRYLSHRFFGETSRSALLDKAIMEQGAQQVHKDFCVHYEASCEGCPFSERVTERLSRPQRD
ncbi:MAG: DUF2851 family protein, partial [Chlamydiia bacterium]|nr:DUF2851 family protein [Chlamydiia bacterium]